MNQMTRIMAVCLIIIGLTATPSWAFRYWGAKPLGMGGAFTAVADDSNAIHWNPAGLTVFNERKQAGFMFNWERHEYILGDYEFAHPEMFTDEEDEDFYGGEVYFPDEETLDREQKMVRDWLHFAIVDGHTAKTFAAGLAFTGYNFPNHTFQDATDYTVELAVAGGMYDLLSFGATGRYVSLVDDTGGEFDMDFGALLNVSGLLGIGLVGRNVFGNDYPRIVRREIALGLAGFVLDYATVSFDLIKVFDVPDADSTFNFAFGAEGIVGEVLALRGGFNWDQVDDAHLYSVGLAYVDNMGTLAYTFQGDIDQYRNTGHSIQVSIYFP